jgi:hypothetical protein
MYFLNINVWKENVNVAKSLNEGVVISHQRFGHLNMVNLKELDKMVMA